MVGGSIWRYIQRRERVKRLIARAALEAEILTKETQSFVDGEEQN
jgi:ABC-type iron transport system FetAB ATPase subunit